MKTGYIHVSVAHSCLISHIPACNVTHKAAQQWCMCRQQIYICIYIYKSINMSTFMIRVTLSYVTFMYDQHRVHLCITSHIHESCHTHMCHVIHTYVMSHILVSCHTHVYHVTHTYVMSHIHVSRHTHIRHVTHSCIMSHTHTSCHTHIYHVTHSYV